MHDRVADGKLLAAVVLAPHVEAVNRGARFVVDGRGDLGPTDDRRYSYEPTFIMRGLSELHITFTPVG